MDLLSFSLIILNSKSISLQISSFLGNFYLGIDDLAFFCFWGVGMARRIYCGNQERIRSFSLVLNNIPFQH